MKTEKNIFIAFVLNLFFAIFEFIGGVFTGSVAIASDAVHDIGDAASIGISWFLERKSKRQPDEVYTYGYTRFSLVGSVLTTVILLTGSLAVGYSAVCRLFNPTEVNYSGMILFAVIGVAVNFIAAYFTREGDSLNQKAVNLHMLEDVFGWTVVLVGAVVMKFTDIVIIDSIMSIGVSLFIIFNAIKNLITVNDIFLEKVPKGISIEEIKEHICKIDGIKGVHHIHVRSLDGCNNYATMHIVTDVCAHEIKEKVRQELREHNIVHATLELESVGEHCHEEVCRTPGSNGARHHHHHHHHH